MAYIDKESPETFKIELTASQADMVFRAQGAEL